MSVQDQRTVEERLNAVRRSIQAAEDFLRLKPNATGTEVALRALQAHGGPMTSGSVCMSVRTAADRIGSGAWQFTENAVRSGLAQLRKTGAARSERARVCGVTKTGYLWYPVVSEQG